jgi:hypothetical protein
MLGALLAASRTVYRIGPPPERHRVAAMQAGPIVEQDLARHGVYPRPTVPGVARKWPGAGPHLANDARPAIRGFVIAYGKRIWAGHGGSRGLLSLFQGPERG